MEWRIASGIAALLTIFLAHTLWTVALERAPDDPHRKHRRIAILDVVLAMIVSVVALGLAAFALTI